MDKKKPKKNPEGRPSKYKPEYINSAEAYLEENRDSITKHGVTVNLPTVEGFARFLKVNKTTLYEWEEAHPEFSNALEEIREEQRKRLLNNGLAGSYNPTIAKLILTSNHGYREKSETDITSKGRAITGIDYIVPHDPRKNKTED